MECHQCGMGINMKLKPNTTSRSLAYKLKSHERTGIKPHHKGCTTAWHWERGR